MRLFVSIDFPEDVREELRSWIPELKGWKKVSQDQIHMTLVFLGECSNDQKKEIHSKLSDIQFPDFSLSISGMGAFPNEKRPRIIWAGTSKNEELMNLQEAVSEKLDEYLRPNKHKEFIPHITLARKKSRRINQEASKALNRQTETLDLLIERFHLKESILKPGGSEHHILHTYQAGSSE